MTPLPAMLAVARLVRLSAVDLSIIAIYFVLVLAIGFYLKRFANNRPYLRKDAPDSHYVSMGRWCTMIGLFVSIGTAYLVQYNKSMMDYAPARFGFFIAPLFATALLGMLWKRVTRMAGFRGLLAGVASSVTIFLLMKFDEHLGPRLRLVSRSPAAVAGYVASDVGMHHLRRGYCPRDPGDQTAA